MSLAKTLPDSYTAAFAKLYYASLSANISDDRVWTLLDASEQLKDNNNVRTVVFEYSLRVTQRLPKPKDSSRCTLVFEPNQYQLVHVQRGTQQSDDITVVLEAKGIPSLDYQGDVDEAKTLPLAVFCQERLRIKLVFSPKHLNAKGGIKASNVDAGVLHLRALLQGIDHLDENNPWYQLLRRNTAVLNAESREQKALLDRFRNCRIVTKANSSRTSIIVEVYPGVPSPASGKDRDAIELANDQKLGMSYMIRAKMFPTDKDSLKLHKIPGSATQGWELIVSKETEHSDAAIIGSISNSFYETGIKDFENKEETGVYLDPIFMDILESRGRSAQGDFNLGLEMDSKELHGFFEHRDKRDPILLPAETLLLDRQCNKEENRLEGIDVDAVDRKFTQRLNPSQHLVFKTALTNKISIAHGPPGTGKSTVLGSIVLYLAAGLGEQVAATAMSNNAVDALLSSCARVWTDKGGTPPFARLYSEAQIRAQWQARDMERLNSPYHIDQLRYQYALKDPFTWGGYIEGREEYKRYQCIPPAAYDSYAEDALELTHRLLHEETGTIKVVFCTVAASLSNQLFQSDPIDGKLLWFFKAKTIVNDEAGTTHMPYLMMLIMSFRASVRLILAGDHLQLPPFVLSKEASTYWPASYLEKIVQKKWPNTMLNVQYRMHDQLYAHLPAIIYKADIYSNSKTSEPSRFMIKMNELMPLRIDCATNTWQLRSFLHFLDVPEGVQVVLKDKSSINVAEALLVNDLVKSFLSHGMPAKSLCVMTGYTGQKKLLTQLAKDNNWAHIARVLTIDSSQGNEYKVVILSLVTTTNNPGFLGGKNRSNVATSRQSEALYFVGKHEYWKEPPEFSRKKYMHQIIKHMTDSAITDGRPPFVIHPTSPAIQEPSVRQSASVVPKPKDIEQPAASQLNHEVANLVEKLNLEQDIEEVAVTELDRDLEIIIGKLEDEEEKVQFERKEELEAEMILERTKAMRKMEDDFYKNLEETKEKYKEIYDAKEKAQREEIAAEYERRKSEALRHWNERMEKRSPQAHS
ncbi:MAG: hypothetical protein Q9178_001714 [Gyalolechia marmorata]